MYLTITVDEYTRTTFHYAYLSFPRVKNVVVTVPALVCKDLCPLNVLSLRAVSGHMHKDRQKAKRFAQACHQNV
jgi:hypothetical protein